MKNVLTFASGSNAGQEIMGFADARMAPGVTVPDFRGNTLPTLEGEFLSTPYPLFLDSGAVAEVEFQVDGPPVVVAPIDQQEWLRRLDVYKHLATLYGNRLYAVAPDRVGSQVDTLDRLTTYREQVRELVDLGANMIFAIQPGELDRHDFLQRCLDAVGLDIDQIVVGFPMRRNVTTAADIELFLDHLQPSKIHLLGLGHINNQFGDITTLIQKHSPISMISNDAVLFRGIVGFGITKGQKDRSRPKDFTKAQIDQADWLAETLWAEPPPVALFGDQIRGDYTDSIAEPAYWMKPSWISTDFPKMVGLTPQEAKLWRQNPDEFLQAEDPASELPYIDLPLVWHTLDHFWAKHHADTTCQQKKRMAIEEIFGPGSKRYAPVPDEYLDREDPMKIVVITSCTGDKAVSHARQITLDEFKQGETVVKEREAELAGLMTPAEDIYTGQQHKRLMRGVKAIRDRRPDVQVRVYVLSAGYGLVDGKQSLAPYEATFTGMKGAEIRAWAKQLGIPQGVREALSQPFDVGFMLLGENYLKACDLGPDVALGGDMVAFCNSKAVPTLEGIGMSAIPLANNDAKRFSCGLIGLKGELTARMLSFLASAPEIDSLDKYLANIKEQKNG